tara:strand:+ start:288 stop:470 length:183 start_codon:yes stop_codon:yes gene_type:complete
MSNYKYALGKIKATKTVEQLKRVETLLTQLYNAEFLTGSEFRRLDCELVDHSLKLEGIIA